MIGGDLRKWLITTGGDGGGLVCPPKYADADRTVIHPEWSHGGGSFPTLQAAIEAFNRGGPTA